MSCLFKHLSIPGIFLLPLLHLSSHILRMFGVDQYMTGSFNVCRVFSHTRPVLQHTRVHLKQNKRYQGSKFTWTRSLYICAAQLRNYWRLRIGQAVTGIEKMQDTFGPYLGLFREPRVGGILVQDLAGQAAPALACPQLRAWCGSAGAMLQEER